MLIYGKAYNECKNKFLIPLIEYSVPYKKLRYNNVKEMILKNIKSVERFADEEFILFVDEEELLKSLLGDIGLFYARKLIQYADVDSYCTLSCSANWNIVTHYYNGFFAASLMLRLCHRGNVFLEREFKKELEIIISEIIGEPIKLMSNQFYEVVKIDNKYVLKITGISDGNTHEIVWKKLDLLMNEILLLAKKRTDEYLILSSIVKINNVLENTYPSKLRNKVNYRPVYGLDYIDKKLLRINRDIDWPKWIISFANTDDDNKIATCMYAYTKYIECFCSNFIAEYYAMRGCENGLLRSINKYSDKRTKADEMIFDF